MATTVIGHTYNLMVLKDMACPVGALWSQYGYGLHSCSLIVLVCIVMAYIVLINVGMTYDVVACYGMTYVVMASINVTCIVMANIGTACIVAAYSRCQHGHGL